MIQGLVRLGVYLRHLGGDEIFMKLVCVYPNAWTIFNFDEYMCM